MLSFKTFSSKIIDDIVDHEIADTECSKAFDIWYNIMFYEQLTHIQSAAESIARFCQKLTLVVIKEFTNYDEKDTH